MILTKIYFQDSFLSIGVRFDDYSLVKQSMFSPKAGLTWEAWHDTTFKLLYGSSFRAPNVWHQFSAYQAYYNEDGSIASQGVKQAVNLKPESANTLQGSWEQKIDRYWLTRATLYYIWLKDLISVAELDADYIHNVNGASQSVWGGEFEIERHWNNGALVRASYSLQNAQNQSGEHLFDSPQHIFKVNMLAPLFHPDWHGGLEILGMGPRHSTEAKVSGYALANLTLNWQVYRNVDLSASVYNLLDRDYFDPRTDGIKVPSNGRDFRLKVQFRF